MVEQPTVNRRVVGSSPTQGAMEEEKMFSVTGCKHAQEQYFSIQEEAAEYQESLLQKCGCITHCRNLNTDSGEEEIRDGCVN